MRRAFTLIEIVIVIGITAVIAVTLVLTFKDTRVKATFDDYESQITNIIQQARTLSLSNILIVDSNTGTEEETDYYALVFTKPSSITLTAYGADVTTEAVDSITLEDGYTINKTFTVYYHPPYGEVCFNTDCDSFTPKIVKLQSTAADTDYSTTFTISAHGGYPEVD